MCYRHVTKTANNRASFLLATREFLQFLASMDR